MKTACSVFLFILLCSCGSQETETTAALCADSLIATTGPIPTAIQHHLTDDDIARLKKHYPKTLERIGDYQPLTMQDIINMTRSGVSDEVIVHEMRATRSTFYLTPQNERTLEQAGVSRRVINEMMDTTVDRY